MTHYSTEIAVVGGGVCGLWVLNLLRSAGYQACLFEKGALGQNQTLASQGMIHGGIKYALGGFTTPASETIASMPATWRACIAGTGPINLSGVPVLSDDYYLFSDGALGAKVTAFFASKSLRGRVNGIERKDYPQAFQSPLFRGNLYKLQDMVVDTSALLESLRSAHSDFIFKADVKANQENGSVSSLTLNNQDSITADQYIFAGGEGNDALLSQLDFVPIEMQRRPLKQVLVKGNLPSIYAHAVSLKDANKPRLTITTHPMRDGDKVWYLGGNLAEQGVGMSETDLIVRAKQELGALLPWVDLSAATFKTLDIDRAEPAQKSHGRPDVPYASQSKNAIFCWPTKLTLTPLLGDEVLQMLPKPRQATWQIPNLPLAQVADTPWEIAFAGT
jgi:glycerol-3-phosphate dehydrogenase